MNYNKTTSRTSKQMAQKIANELFAAPIGGEFEPHQNPKATKVRFHPKYGGPLRDTARFEFKIGKFKYKVEVIKEDNIPFEGNHE